MRDVSEAVRSINALWRGRGRDVEAREAVNAGVPMVEVRDGRVGDNAGEREGVPRGCWHRYSIEKARTLFLDPDESTAEPASPKQTPRLAQPVTSTRN